MKFYSKDDLQFDDYTWEATPSDSHKLQNFPDRNQFNSAEGYEVLYLINTIAEMTGLTSNSDCQRIETLIHDKLPIGRMSQVTAAKWLREQLEN